MAFARLHLITWHLDRVGVGGMALMRAQARQLLFRLQGAVVNADAALAGAQHSADQTCTTLAAADGALITRAS